MDVRSDELVNKSIKNGAYLKKIQDKQGEELANEILELYGDNNSKKNIRTHISNFCDTLNDGDLLYFVFHLMKLETERFKGTGHYLRITDVLCSNLYAICAKRFNYYFVLGDDQITPEPMKLLNKLLVDRAEKINGKTGQDDKPINGLDILVSDIQFKLQAVLLGIMDEGDNNVTNFQKYATVGQKVENIKNVCARETNALESMMLQSINLKDELELQLQNLDDKKTPVPNKSTTEVQQAFNIFQTKFDGFLPKSATMISPVSALVAMEKQKTAAANPARAGLVQDVNQQIERWIINLSAKDKENNTDRNNDKIKALNNLKNQIENCARNKTLSEAIEFWKDAPFDKSRTNSQVIAEHYDADHKIGKGTFYNWLGGERGIVTKFASKINPDVKAEEVASFRSETVKFIQGLISYVDQKEEDQATQKNLINPGSGSGKRL